MNEEDRYLADRLLPQCDRELPECLKCKEAGATCIQRRMGVVIDPSQPDASSYIESLQKRVQHLERQRTEGQPSSPPANDLSSRSPEQHIQERGNQEHEKPDSNANGASLETTMHVMDYLPLSAMAELRDRPQISLQRYSFQTFLTAATSVLGADPARSDVSNRALLNSVEAFYQNVNFTGSQLLRSVADIPVQRYLCLCDASLPFLERKEFLAIYDRCMDDMEKSQDVDFAARAPHELLLVYFAVATGILLSPDYRYKEGIAITFAHSALRLMPRVLNESENASIVRSLIALAIFSTCSTLGGSTWHIIGLALARSMSAGMHTEGVSDIKAADGEKRENSRLFWSLYVLDASVTCTMGECMIHQLT